MCAPFAVIAPIITGIASVGLSIYGAVAQAQSAQQQADYSNQVAQAQAEFAFQEQSRQQDFLYRQQLTQAETAYQQALTAREYEYNQQVVQYDYTQREMQRKFEYEQAVNQQQFEYQQAQVDAQRRFEAFREEQQKSVMELNAELAGAAYANDLRALDLRFMQEEEAAAQQKLKAGKEAAQARAEIRASARTGNTVDNLIADYYRQQAAFDFATNRNMAFTTADIQQQKRGAQSTYAARKASEQPYIPQPFTNPILGQTMQPGAGVAPMRGAMPVRQEIKKGIVVQSPVYKSYVNTTPYYVEGAAGVLSGVTRVANAWGAMDAYNASRPASTPKPPTPPAPKQPGRS